MPNYDHVEDNLHSWVSVTQFRRNLSAYIATVRYRNDFVCIRRRGRDPVYLVSQDDFDRIKSRRSWRDAPPESQAPQRKPRGFWRRLFRRDKAQEPEAPVATKTAPSLMETFEKIDKNLERLKNARD